MTTQPNKSEKKYLFSRMFDVDDVDVDRPCGFDISLVTGFIVKTSLGLHVL